MESVSGGLNFILTLYWGTELYTYIVLGATRVLYHVQPLDLVTPGGVQETRQQLLRHVHLEQEVIITMCLLLLSSM